MADYAKMYKTLFTSQTEAIAILQKAQQETEEIYISAPDPDIRVFEPRKPEDEKDE
jgi:UDP-N-acetylmuramoylalanine-D-glutamate ligase